MADPGGKGSLAALIALKIVCCGGLLLAAGVLSAGGLMTLLENPVVRTVGIALVAAAVWVLARRRAARGKTDRRSQERACSPGHRESHDVP